MIGWGRCGGLEVLDGQRHLVHVAVERSQDEEVGVVNLGPRRKVCSILSFLSRTL